MKEIRILTGVQTITYTVRCLAYTLFSLLFLDYNTRMVILQVAPLLRLPSTLTEYLTYYHTEHVPRGSVVRVPVGNGHYLGVVLFSQSLEEAKMAVRKGQHMSLKHIDSVFWGTPLLSEEQLRLAEWMARSYAFSLGMLLRSFLPRIHSGLKNVPREVVHLPAPRAASVASRPALGVITISDARRPTYIHDLLSAHAKQSGQLLFLVPSLYALQFYAASLKEIFPEEQVSILTSSLSTRQFRTEWVHIRDGTRRVILGTRAALFVPFADLNTILMEDESSNAYYSFDMYPRYHTADVAYQMARLHNARLIFSGPVPSLKSLHLLHTHGISAPEFPPLPVERMTHSNLANERRPGEVPLIGAEALATVAADVPTLILSNRRGSSPFIICRACGFRFTCPHCDSLLVEHTFHVQGSAITHIFVCHKCTSKFKPRSQCPECQSPDIKYGGAGTEKVAEHLQETFPNVSVRILDTDYTPDFETQADVFQRWQAGEISILVATHMVEKFLALPLAHAPLTIIRESDLALRFPQFSAKEHALQSFARVILQSRHTYLQSWNPAPPEEQTGSPLAELQAGNFAQAYTQEQTERRMFGYPPFQELIAIHSLNRKRQKAWEQARRTKRVFSEIDLKPLGPVESVRRRGQFQVTLLFCVEPETSYSFKRRLLGLLERGQQIDINPLDVL